MSTLRQLRTPLVALALAATAFIAIASSWQPRAALAGKGCPPGIPEFPSTVYMPPIQPWNGAPPAVGPHTVMIIQRDVQYPGYYVAYQVEWTDTAVKRAILVPAGQLPQFIDSAVLASIIVRHPTPPPPPINPDELLRRAWAADDNNPI